MVGPWVINRFLVIDRAPLRSEQLTAGRFNGLIHASLGQGARMTSDWQALFDLAKAAQAQAYAPYSRYRVGAAVRTADGQMFAGCNVENAAYPLGTCAEAGAIAAMVAGGGRAIAAAVVVADGVEVVTPCGACRQRLREFARGDVEVLCASLTGEAQRFTVEVLLPSAFGPDHLP
jgi:cytidine deaminase